jgi:hypothetical protein
MEPFLYIVFPKTEKDYICTRKQLWGISFPMKNRDRQISLMPHKLIRKSQTTLGH